LATNSEKQKFLHLGKKFRIQVPILRPLNLQLQRWRCSWLRRTFIQRRK
jgi:hypothetical protein